ncbi:TlpA family protein disulfide reductase [Frisingicoccus caecimuris]|uniref:Thiol-disulfide isomerase/thioredoxin n=1 Tax=Frisingicoccus caecimuris TaxID=1796636 RepID=A0A4R2LBW7_9FIRM|nr:TlpA disulfide reductase family protein [Frisingicoccus caecimuris]MCR1918466.1 TlpA family protein disulfide reductase [Frisingicoccus caecimuris]TCO85112.1 thiol-disulfide isomerase/thioredoxin [Frisingicoccus caecimuris]
MKKVITLILALTMVFSLAACGNTAGNDTGVSASGDDTSQSQPPATEFEPIPLGEFSAQDFSGNTVTKDIFADYDLTMVNLWTTTCGYCIEEMPVLNELRKEFQDDGISFNIISVCMDVGNTDEINDANLKKAQEIIEKAGVEYPNLIPDSVLLEGRLKGIQAFPESFFVDSEGNVVSEPYVGALPKNHWRVTMNNEIDKLKQAETEE